MELNGFIQHVDRLKILFSLCLVLVAASGCNEPGYGEPTAVSSQAETALQTQGSIRIGGPAPDFKLWNLQGQAVSLSDYRGSVVFVNFWATWCGPCKVEMPAMERLYRDFQSKGLEILAVSTDAQGAVVTRPFQEKMGLTFPILHDSDYTIGRLYGARTLPMSFLIDRQGIIRHRIFGARDWHSPEAIRMIQTLLKEVSIDGVSLG